MPDTDQREVHARLNRARMLLGRLGRSPALAHGDVQAAYREVTELAAELLAVERASVWTFDPLRREIRCVDLFEARSRRHSAGSVITASEVPSYFEALAAERVIAASDAHVDARTCELTEHYLKPLGIGALLDAPIWVDGGVVGVVCHEHVGPARAWTFVEELLAGTVADFVARVFEVAQRLRAEEALGAFRERLGELAELHASQAERLQSDVDSWRGHSEEDAGELVGLLESSPLPLVVSGRDDAIVRYVNRPAAELFESSVAEMTGSSGQRFWADAGERLALTDALRRNGRADGFVALLETRKQRRFWALLSARSARFRGEDCIIIGVSDITAQKLAEIAVREGAERIRQVFEAAPVALVLSRARDQAVLLANPVAARLFEVPLDAVVGQRAPDFYVDPRDRERVVAQVESAGHVDSIVVRLRTASGREFWGMLSVRRIEFDGEPSLLVGVADVTAQKQAEQALRDLATRDALTGIPNRRWFEEVACVEIARAQRTERPLTLAMLDIDHFKRINDELGHPEGDRVLQTIARESRAELRTGDLFARVGGEEFAIVFPETDLETARAVAERLREHLARVSPVTVSLGLAKLAEGENLEELRARADQALYRAKHAGRNRVSD